MPRCTTTDPTCRLVRVHPSSAKRRRATRATFSLAPAAEASSLIPGSTDPARKSPLTIAVFSCSTSWSVSGTPLVLSMESDFNMHSSQRMGMNSICEIRISFSDLLPGWWRGPVKRAHTRIVQFVPLRPERQMTMFGTQASEI